MNFKTMIRGAKLPMRKRSFRIGTHRVVNADNHMIVWAPDETEGTLDVDDKLVEDPEQNEVVVTAKALSNYSPPLNEMVKVNSEFLRRVISALETKGKTPVYLKLKDEYICLAYEVDGEVHRAVVACMRNGE